MSAFAVAVGGKADVGCCTAYVRFWPLADIGYCTARVRSPGTNELELVKLKTAPSIKIKPPRVSESPVAFKCRLLTSL
jgi:hypothetical protein